MDRVCIHIGVSLLAIKRMCETREECGGCPLYKFCGDNDIQPWKWKNEVFPDAGLIWDLTDTKEK